MRPTRVIYVENDPALRGIITQLLEQRPEIDVLLATGIAHEALDQRIAEQADVALLDLALGSSQMNGIDLGLALRSLNANMGIVIHSQYRLDTVARTVPPEALIGWVTLPKSGELPIEELIKTLRDAARGMTMTEAPGDDSMNPLEDLSIRQRAVMGMAASGVKTTEIARRLQISHDAVRQDLSRAYRTLVPDADPESDDLRTRAVLAYLELTRDDDVRDGL
ncbi:MAG: response regulator [Candidatus Nanopelagicales bacterium]